MSVPSSLSGLNVDCIYEIDDQKRVANIVELAKKWEWLEKSDFLHVDCESSNLFKELDGNGISVYKYSECEGYQNDKCLFLEKSDPVEAIIAGAECPGLMVHVKQKSLNEISAVKVFSKRIISRATTKVYLFLDQISVKEKDQSKDEKIISGENVGAERPENYTIRMTQENVIRDENLKETIFAQKSDNYYSEEINPEKSIYNQNHEEINVTQSGVRADIIQLGEVNHCQCGEEATDIKICKVDDIPSDKINGGGHFNINRQTYVSQYRKDVNIEQTFNAILLANYINKEYKKADFTSQIIFEREPYQFFQGRNLVKIDNRLKDIDEEVYLVRKEGKTFLFSSNAQKEKEVMKAQQNIRSVSGENLPAFSDNKLICESETKDFTVTSKWFNLLTIKDWGNDKLVNGVPVGQKDISTPTHESLAAADLDSFAKGLRHGM